MVGTLKSTQPAPRRAFSWLLLLAGAAVDVQAKHEAIMDLEARINEVAQMFSDLALLVNVQGEILNRIEDNVTACVHRRSHSTERTQTWQRHCVPT